MSYLISEKNNPIPQSEPINPNQVQNNAGGFVFEIDKWARLRRFLILGSEGGTYYVSQRKLTRDNLSNLSQCIEEDGPRVVKEIVEISTNALSPKNDPALFALAMCASAGQHLLNTTNCEDSELSRKYRETRKSALQALPKVVRIGTHLFHFLEYIKD